MNKHHVTTAILGASVVLLFLAGFVSIPVYKDPLAEFQTLDGKLSIPGGKFTPELQRLVFPPAPPETYWTYEPERSGRPTLNIVGTQHDYPEVISISPSRAQPGAVSKFIDRLWTGLKEIANGMLSFFVGGASAAVCGDGAGPNTCTWDGGGADELWSTSGNWDGVGAPQAGDIVIFVGASSNKNATIDIATPALKKVDVTSTYSGTIDLQIDQTQEWGDGSSGINYAYFAGGIFNTNDYLLKAHGIYIGPAGVFNAGASTIENDGPSSLGGSAFNHGTSTLVLHGNADYIMDYGSTHFYNITITACGLGVYWFTDPFIVVGTLSIQGGGCLSPDFTLTYEVMSVGNLTISGTGVLDDIGSGVELTVLGNVDLSGTGGIRVLGNVLTVRGSWSNTLVPTLYALPGVVSFSSTAAGPFTMHWLGGVSNEFNSLSFNTSAASAAVYNFDNNLKYSGTLTNSPSGANEVGLVLGAYTVTGGSANIGIKGYLDLGSSVWTLSGTWTNASTSVSWDEGGGAVSFTRATGGTMTFAGTAFDEFNNVTFTSSAATPQTFTMATRGLRWGGTLTISDGTSTTALATANLALGNFSSGSLVVGNGGILTANASTVFVGSVQMTGGASGTITLTSGAWRLGAVGAYSWDTSGAGSTFTQGASTVTIGNGAGSPTVKMLATQDFYNLDIDAGTSASALSDLQATNTVHILATGSLAMGTQDLEFETLTLDGSLTADGITASALSMATSSGTILLTNIAGYNPPSNAQWTFDPSAAGATVTLTFDNVALSAQYQLYRDGVLIDSQQSVANSVTFVVTAGWSSRVMTFSVFGSGGPPPATETILVGRLDGNAAYSFTLQIDGQAASVLWDFGDGSSLETTSGFIVHSYQSSGDYTVTATVTKTDGRTIVLTKTITVSWETTGWGYVILGLTIVFLVGALLSQNESTKFALAILGLVTLLIQFRPEFFGESSVALTTVGTTAVGYLILALGGGGLLASFLRTKAGRARGAWFLFGVVALALWYFLK